MPQARAQKQEQFQDEAKASDYIQINGSKKVSYSDLENECLLHMATNKIPFSGPLNADGILTRFSIDDKKNQEDEWYVCHKGESKLGYPYLTCSYGTWSGGSTTYSYKSFENDNSLSKEEWRQLKIEEEKRRKELEEQFKNEREKKIEKAKKIWEKSKSEPTRKEHAAYLEKKKIKAFGVKFGSDSYENNVLIIPMRDIKGEIQGVQFIKGDGEKRIHGSKKGNFHLLGEVKDACTIFVTEGYATGATVHEATGHPVFVAFDCGNLDFAISNIRDKYPTHIITIAADNDSETEGNPGKTKAEGAAKKYKCNIALPEFPNEIKLSDGKQPTDFNDLHVHFGIDEVKKQLITNKNDPPTNSINVLKTILKEDQQVFKPHSFKELMTMPPKKWLVDQVFGTGDIGMIYGAPGCGKTFTVIDMIIALCTGKQWAKRFDVQGQLNVAYCAGEGISGLPSRFAAAAKYHNVSSLSNFIFYNTMPQLYDCDGHVEVTINQFINEWRARQHAKKAETLDVLVIDTLHTAITAADENSAQDMGKVLQSCRLVANELGCAVILVHHTNKGGTSERGSSALRGAMDFMIEIKKSSDTGTNAVMSCSKLKDGEQWKEQNFNLCLVSECNSVHVLWNNPNDPNDGKSQLKSKADDKKNLLTAMESSLEGRFTCKSLAEVIAQYSNYTNKLLKELVSAKKCKMDLSDPNKPPSTKNPWVYWCENPKEK